MLVEFLDELLEQLGCLQHVVDAELGDAQAVVGDAVVRPVVRPYLLVDVAVADLVTLELALLRRLLLLEHRVQTLL